MSGQDIEGLVNLITSRVEAELAKRLGIANAEGACGTCSAGDVCEQESVIDSINQGAGRLGSAGPVSSAPCGHVAPLIDHTLLKPEATKEELRKVCDEARAFGFASVCVNSANVRFVAACLEGTSVMPIAVVGFPLGAATPAAKAFETREAIRAGAKEIDMVINIGSLKSHDYRAVLKDIEAVVDASGRAPVKVILETAKLDRDEKVVACALSKAAGAAFVKTSTGFGGGGATPEDVALMRSVVGEELGVKASGGIRDIDDAEAAVAAGATRIGASSSVKIVQCVRDKSKGGY